MAKLKDLFTQVKRTQSGGGMGFLGKGRTETKPRAAALVVELTQVSAGSAEAVLKAGADGLLFTWDGKDDTLLETVKQEIDAAKASNEGLVTGLRISGGYDALDREALTNIKEQGIQYIVLPLDAPVRLLALETKDIEIVVTVPMRTGELYPLFIRNLTAFDNLGGAELDFKLSGDIGAMSIEEVLQYRAVREAVRVPALLKVQPDLSEEDAYTLMTLGVQALILGAKDTGEATRKQIKHVRSLLEAVHHEEKDAISLRKPS